MKRLISAGFFSLFLWILIEQIMQTMLGNMDTLLLSMYSDNAVAAVGLANQIIVIGTMLLSVVPIGSSIILNQLHHVNDEKKKNHIIRTTIWLNIILSGMIFIAFFLFADYFLNLLNTPKEIRHIGKQYLQIISASLILQSLASGWSAIFRAYGFAKQAMYVFLISNILNVIGNALVILTPFSLIGEGVVGVAWSTFIARLVSVFAYLFLFAHLTKKSIVNYILPGVFTKEIKHIFKLGLPSAMESFSYNISQAILTSIITKLGLIVLTAKIYTTTITSFIFAFSFSWSLASQLMIGKLVGKGDIDEARTLGAVQYKTAAIFTTLLVILLAVFSPYIIPMLTSDTEIHKIAVHLIILCILLEPARCINSVIIANLNSAADVLFPVVVGAITTYALVIPASFFSVGILHTGVYGIWVTMILDEWIRAGIFIHRWKHKELKNITTD